MDILDGKGHHMITAKQLSELLSFKTPAANVLSAYFELEPGDDAPALARRLERMTEKSQVLQALREDVELVARYLVEEFEPGRARAVAIFSSKRFGLFRVCHLTQPVKTALIVDNAPALKPLVSITDQHHRFAVALVGPRSARFFEAFLGRGREYEEHALNASAYPDAAAYVKAVADKLEELSRNQGCQRVVVGVAEDLSRALLGRLHSTVQQNLIVDNTLAPDATCAEVVDRIASCETEARKVRESVLAHRLVDSAKTTRSAVIGLDRVLDAFQKGTVKVLLVRDGFAKMGRSCPRCNELSIGWNKCVTCNTPTEAVFNLVGELIHRALERGCEVVRLMHETPLDNLGRVGAELAPTAAKQNTLAAGESAAAGSPAAA